MENDTVFFPAGTTTCVGIAADGCVVARSTLNPPGGAMVVSVTLAGTGPQAGTLAVKLSALSRYTTDRWCTHRWYR